MTALMGLNHTHMRKYLNVILAGEANAFITKEKSTVQFINPLVTIASGKDAGKILNDGEGASGDAEGNLIEPKVVLDPRYTYELNFGTLKTGRYEVLQRLHPDLARNAMVSAPGGYDTHQETALTIVLKPLRNIELSKLPWIMGLSILY